MIRFLFSRCMRQLSCEHAKLQQAIELHMFEQQTKASETLFAFIQARQNLENHLIV